MEGEAWGSFSPTPPWLLLLTAPLGEQVWLPNSAWYSAAGGPGPLWGLEGGTVRGESNLAALGERVRRKHFPLIQ